MGKEKNGTSVSNRDMLLLLMKKVDDIDGKIDKVHGRINTKVDKTTFQWMVGVIFLLLVCIIGAMFA